MRKPTKQELLNFEMELRLLVARGQLNEPISVYEAKSSKDREQAWHNYAAQVWYKQQLMGQM